MTDVEYLVNNKVPNLVDEMISKLVAAKPKDPIKFLGDFLATPAGTKKVFFHIGSNNWAGPTEPVGGGSGVVHENLHKLMNALPNTKCYSIWPSKNQTTESVAQASMRVFSIPYNVPCFESAGPVSSIRYHDLTEEQIKDYITRLENLACEFLDEIERDEGVPVTFSMMHHCFLNVITMRNVNRRRKREGKPIVPLSSFVHGTAVKMYEREMTGTDPKFPPRFYKWMLEEKCFDDFDCGVRLAFGISEKEKTVFQHVFPTYPMEKYAICPPSYNSAFARDPSLTLEGVLKGFKTSPYEGQGKEAVALPTNYKHCVCFAGRFVDWKRVPALLMAAKKYESEVDGIATVIIGQGPVDTLKEYHALIEKLGLKHTYLVGWQGHKEMNALFNVSTVGVFPSKNEPFGLVYIECMACGTPVIGAASGGPKDFIIPAVGELIEETDSLEVLGERIGTTVVKAVKEDWKKNKWEACLKLATNYDGVSSLQKQLEISGKILGLTLV
eukprot:NODE_486_length_1616_cov_539.996809_g370_i0.p1 GENE.NODE_486_length_1616_cov_539.996809_g370_i0~~NODE_486_length_1616_cov_539.996809_g370_i0.p1  ORF type:complete len:518 (+),score=143.51 NODE_486_length_1616_cov_539.996809_g370_i0:63-1556(+)